MSSRRTLDKLDRRKQARPSMFVHVGAEHSCSRCKRLTFPLFTCKRCSSGEIFVCLTCLLGPQLPCSGCGNHTDVVRNWVAEMSSPLKPGWMYKTWPANRGMVLNRALSVFASKLGFTCCVCQGTHTFMHCPLTPVACAECDTTVYLCDRGFHREHDCPDIRDGILTRLPSLTDGVTLSCPASTDPPLDPKFHWSCALCLRCVTPVRLMCRNGHIACSSCWCTMHYRASLSTAIKCPICRVPTPASPAPCLYSLDETEAFYKQGYTCLLCQEKHAIHGCPYELTRCPACKAVLLKKHQPRHALLECGLKPSLQYTERIFEMWRKVGVRNEMPDDLLSLSLLMLDPQLRLIYGSPFFWVEKTCAASK